jgi:hypothetical protein
VELGGEGAEDPGHHDVVQSSPIDEWISDVGEDVVIKGVAMKREKHEVAPPLVVERRGFPNDRDHRSYVLEAGSLRMQVHGEAGVGFGAGVDGAIVVVILGNHDPLGNGKLLFQVTSDDLLLLPSKGGGALMHLCLIHGLACGRHGSDESILLLVRGRGIILLPLGSGGGRGGGMLPIDGGEVGVATRHSQQDDGG